MGHASLRIIALVVRKHDNCRGKVLSKCGSCRNSGVAEIILEFPPDDRAGALETAERRFLAAALDHGCTEMAARSRVSVVMRRLRSHLERQRASEKKLQALLHRLTEPD